MKQFYCIVFLIFGLGISAFSQKVDAALDRDEIKIGEQANIRLEVRFSAATENVMLPQLTDTITKFIEVIQVGNVDTTFDEEDITQKILTQKITVTSWDSGFHAIPPFLFTIDGKNYETEPLLLTVNTVPIQAEQDIKDINSIIEVPFSLSDWIISNRVLLGTILLVILLIIGIVLLVKKLRNKPPTEFKMVIPKESADVIAFKKLAELEEQKLWQNNRVKEYQSEVSFIVREYIEHRFHIRALEMTTDELITAINTSSEVSDEERKNLHQILLTADMAKFAKQQPVASENEESLKLAKLFVEKTRFVAEPDPAATETTTIKEEDKS